MQLEAIRECFPSLQAMHHGRHGTYWDNPAGTQVPKAVVTAVSDYFLHANANKGGAFATSQATDRMVQGVRQKVAQFLGVQDPSEIVFGPNMTTLNFSFSRAIGAELEEGDEVLVTRLDHDANIAPWQRMAADCKANLRWVDISASDFGIDMDSLRREISPRTKLVATVHASNATGTINPIQDIAKLAHEVGAIHVLDAVQSAPHLPISIPDLGCDALLCSAYKFYGPHVGVLWAHRSLLERLPAYQVRPAPQAIPYRWETGTLAFELIAGVGAAIDHMQSIGWDWIVSHEQSLAMHFLEVLAQFPRVKVFGITEPSLIAKRVPTIAFEVEGIEPKWIAQRLAEENFFVWNGNYYALEVMRWLGRPQGLVRVGFAHYNSHDEIEAFARVFRRILG